MWRSDDLIRRNRRIFHEELDGFLPPRILDFHVHIFPREALPEGESYICGGHPIAQYTIGDYETNMAAVLPGRSVSAVIFGSPNPRYNTALNNRYVAECARDGRYTPFRLFDPLADTPESLSADVAAGLFRGIKPYLSFARRENPDDVRIPDMLPEWAVEIAAAHKLIIMLHVPRSLRLADPDNRKHVVDYAAKYPDASIVLAHVGRAYFLKNVTGSLDAFIGLPNVYIDLAMLNNWEVLEYTFRRFPSERILFASDIPIALAPGKSVEINDQYTYVTPVPWKLSISDEHGKLVFTSFLYEELRAIRKAVERLGLGNDFVRDVFFNNGMRLLGRLP
ncbi:MAG TPA: hypothetical protein ENN09_05025 [Planctomycetes bacterium]|nr:hypothetical protein [Planctomycetota bacterium]